VVDVAMGGDFAAAEFSSTAPSLRPQFGGFLRDGRVRSMVVSTVGQATAAAQYQ